METTGGNRLVRVEDFFFFLINGPPSNVRAIIFFFGQHFEKRGIFFGYSATHRRSWFLEGRGQLKSGYFSKRFSYLSICWQFSREGCIYGGASVVSRSSTSLLRVTPMCQSCKSLQIRASCFFPLYCTRVFVFLKYVKIPILALSGAAECAKPRVQCLASRSCALFPLVQSSGPYKMLGVNNNSLLTIATSVLFA